MCTGLLIRKSNLLLADQAEAAALGPFSGCKNNVGGRAVSHTVTDVRGAFRTHITELVPIPAAVGSAWVPVRQCLMAGWPRQEWEGKSWGNGASNLVGDFLRLLALIWDQMKRRVYLCVCESV